MIFQFQRTLRCLILGTATVLLPVTSYAGTYNLTVDKVLIPTNKGFKKGIGYNGTSPGPVLRFREGEDVIINVTNNLRKSTSIHWHGLILPYQMDGVPGISYPGIAAGQTFTYRFPIVQSGTYWFHSHTGFQEPDGAYGAIVIEPAEPEPFKYDREYVVQLTDKHHHHGAKVMRNLKQMPDYYNRKQQTLLDFFKESSKKGTGAAWAERRAWGEMRMMRSDVEDVQGFTGLINGKTAEQNWTGLFKPGERIRLRFINSSAMTYFDIRIPDLEMTVVQSDGNNVQPVAVDEFRIAVAETYDVIVQPKASQAYTIFAESMGRSGYARATLAPNAGMQAQVPALRDAPLLTMADMRLDPNMAGMDHSGMEGMDHSNMAGMEGMDHSTMDMTAEAPAGAPVDHSKMDHSKMDMPAPAPVDHSKMDHSKMAMPTPAPAPVDHSKMDHSQMAMPAPAPVDHSTMDHSQMNSTAGSTPESFYAPGSGLIPAAANGGKFLSYSDLKAQKPLYEQREPTREIELRLTGNMERYFWSINNVKYEDAEPIRLIYGERVRFKFVNETMMTHPMHLHGMWSMLDNGNGQWNPVKHVISVNPGTVVYMETEVDAPGQWAFHCHLSYHAASGMFRKVIVEGGPKTSATQTADPFLAVHK